LFLLGKFKFSWISDERGVPPSTKSLVLGGVFFKLDRIEPSVSAAWRNYEQEKREAQEREDF
jgi:hypothetical protein